MNDHIRPAHPGCVSCRQLQSELTHMAGAVNVAAIKLADAHQQNRPAAVETFRAEINDLKTSRAQTLDVYNQHYSSSHPNFADADQPFRRAPSHRLTADDIEEIKNLLRDGLPYAEIADAFDVSPSTIQHHATRAGLTTTERKAEERADDHRGMLRADQPWAVAALCAQTDPEAFFPEKGGSTREAKAICASCTVAAECLDYALDNQERFGIWGGLSERERRKLLKAIGREEVPPPATEGTAA